MDHFIVFGEAHLRGILRTYAGYYNLIRTRRSLDKDAPVSRPIQRIGTINSYAILGGFIIIICGPKFSVQNRPGIR